MRSKTVTLRIPAILHEAGVEMSKEEYQNFNEFMVGLLRYAIAIHKPHLVTAEIARLSLAEQDLIDDEIVKMYREGRSNKGQWIQHIVEQAAARVANGEDIPKDRLAREIIKLLARKPALQK